MTSTLISQTPLMLHVITIKPSDFPSSIVVRVHELQPDGELVAWAQPMIVYPAEGDNLETIRKYLDEMGLACVKRHEEDDPVIVETWIRAA